MLLFDSKEPKSKDFPRRFRLTLLIMALSVMYGCDKEVVLHAQLSEADANEVVAVLIENGMKATKQVNKDVTSVYVSEAEMSEAVNLLRSRGLPRKYRKSLGDIFKKEGIVSSPMEERARYIYALSQELEFTLSQIHGVVMARVHVVLPEKIAPGEPLQLSSASVFIKHLQSLDPDVIRPKIKRMVASSIPGLAKGAGESIAVVFVSTSDV